MNYMVMLLSVTYESTESLMLVLLLPLVFVTTKSSRQNVEK